MLRYIIMAEESRTFYPYPPPQGHGYGLLNRLVCVAEKQLSPENSIVAARVLGGLAGLTAAGCAVSANLVAKKAREEKSQLNKVLVGAAAVGTAAAAVGFGSQSLDLIVNYRPTLQEN